MFLVLDSGGLSRLAERSSAGRATLLALRDAGLWPPIVPSVVLVESLRGSPRDVPTDRLLATCAIAEQVPERLARRAAALRTRARRGSAVDAVLVAMAECGGTVLTSDRVDLSALAEHADDVEIREV